MFLMFVLTSCSFIAVLFCLVCLNFVEVGMINMIILDSSMILYYSQDAPIRLSYLIIPSQSSCLILVPFNIAPVEFTIINL